MQAEEQLYSHQKYTVLDRIEQKLNTVTHGIGAGMSAAGLVFLLVLAVPYKRPLYFVTFSVYGACQILLYLTSTLTHAFHDMPKASFYLRILDQTSIYLLIAGTYTPTVLIWVGGSAGWTMFGIQWGLAVLGILSKTLIFKEKNVISDLFYLPMGWLLLFFLKPVLASAPSGLLMWIAIGGGCYSLGIIFYLIKKLPLSHVIWHIFVIGGGVSFFLGFALHLF